MSMTLDAVARLVKPHNDRIVAEHRLETALRENDRLRTNQLELIGTLGLLAKLESQPIAQGIARGALAKLKV